jgi:hypothetical protein
LEPLVSNSLNLVCRPPSIDAKPIAIACLRRILIASRRLGFRRMAAECDDLADDLDEGSGNRPSAAASNGGGYVASPLLSRGAR